MINTHYRMESVALLAYNYISFFFIKLNNLKFSEVQMFSPIFGDLCHKSFKGKEILHQYFSDKSVFWGQVSHLKISFSVQLNKCLAVKITKTLRNSGYHPPVLIFLKFTGYPISAVFFSTALNPSCPFFFLIKPE